MKTEPMVSGVDLLHDPILNKGIAFTEPERDALRLRGLLPPRVSSQDEQISRTLAALLSVGGRDRPGHYVQVRPSCTCDSASPSAKHAVSNASISCDRLQGSFLFQVRPE